MADTIFLRLDARFALGADDLQWIVYKSRCKDAPSFNAPLKARDWFPVSFISSTKDILLRVLREKGCSLLIEAQEALAVPSKHGRPLIKPAGG
jgi:hypothetical protein